MSIITFGIAFHLILFPLNLLFICLCLDAELIHGAVILPIFDPKIHLFDPHHFQLMIVDESRERWIEKETLDRAFEYLL